MPTANETIRDLLVRHQVNLQRLSSGLQAEAVGVLDRTEAQLVAEIQQALDRGATVATDSGLRQLQRLEDVVRAIRTGAISDVYQSTADSMADLVRHEAEFTASTLDTASPTQLDLTLPDPSTLAALVSGGLFEGQLLQTWFQALSEGDSTRIMNAVKVGMTRGLSNQDILRMVVGSGAFDGSDGATALTRNQLGSLVRTAVNAFSNRARSLVAQANADVLEYERYTATLDSRTTIICMSLDGTLYRVGEGKFPPQHFGCRSIRVPALDPVAVGTRPMKPTTERMLVAEYADKNGYDALVRSDLPRGTLGDFDKFAAARVRQLTGTVPASTTYGDFLSAQPAAFQDEVLGATKAALFRDGGLSLSKFTTRAGTELTLDQLASTNRAAFVKAGLDPGKYAQ